MNEVSIIPVLIALLQQVNVWEFWGVIAAVLLVPWLVCLYIAMRLTASTNALKEQLIANREADHKRFEAVAQFYEKNTLLVENHQRMADQLFDVVRLNTMAITKLIDRIDNNHFCPAVRKKGNPDG